MFDIILESVRAIVLFGLIVFLLRQERSAAFNVSAGWRAIVYGFSLLLFGSILDITDNFESLNKFVIIGDTPTEAILEKLVGFLGGFVLLAVGLIIWIPKYLNDKKVSDEFFQKAFHSSPVLLTVSRPSDGGHFDVNETWCSITGYSYEEAMENSALKLGLWENPEDRVDLITELEKTGAAKGLETIFRTKSGELRNILVSGEFIQVGNDKRFLFIGQDITHLREIERLKSEFVSIVSHELRTPLTSIHGALGLVLGGAVGEISEKSHELIQLAERNCDRLSSLVNDILDLEKLQTGAMEFLFDIVNLNELVSEAIAQCAPYADEYSVEFIEKKSSPNLFVYADKGRLNQIMLNLLSNAAKFSPKGEKIEIAVSKIANNARVEVIDHGLGIEEEFRDKIFERFAQADASDTRSKQGSGLGLTITKSIIEKHDGTIGFDSIVGAGTTFFIELPLYDKINN
jgi:PAS domain S-box-containing protein